MLQAGGNGKQEGSRGDVRLDDSNPFVESGLQATCEYGTVRYGTSTYVQQAQPS